MTLARTFLSFSWRTVSRPAAPVRDPLLGVSEVDLDVHQAHFGPTLWCRSWQDWQQQLRRDRPAQIYLTAAQRGERRVLAVLNADQAVPGVDAAGFACLKYYRLEHGRSVAVSFALEALAAQAAD